MRIYETTLMRDLAIAVWGFVIGSVLLQLWLLYYTYYIWRP